MPGHEQNPGTEGGTAGGLGGWARSGSASRRWPDRGGVVGRGGGGVVVVEW